MSNNTPVLEPMTKNMPSIALFISGRGSNMEAILQQVLSGILSNCCRVALVFSNKPDAGGLAIAQGLGFPTACVPSKGKKREAFDAEICALLEPYRIDYIVLAGYDRLISPVLIDRYDKRIINIHPADTRLFQGLGAYKWAFEQQLESTYITIHYVDAGMDTGSIIAQQKVDLRGATSLQEVEKRGLAMEHVFYSQTLRAVFSAVSFNSATPPLLQSDG